MNLGIFRASDIRGLFSIDFEPTDFFHIARAFAARFRPNIVAVGHDVRESSPLLWRHVTAARRDAGVDVLNLGQISTDRLTFAVAHYQTDGGIILSASHTPAAYNGMKLVRHQAQPLSSDTGLFACKITPWPPSSHRYTSICQQRGLSEQRVDDVSRETCEHPALRLKYPVRESSS